MHCNYGIRIYKKHPRVSLPGPRRSSSNECEPCDCILHTSNMIHCPSSNNMHTYSLCKLMFVFRCLLIHNAFGYVMPHWRQHMDDPYTLYKLFPFTAVIVILFYSQYISCLSQFSKKMYKTTNNNTILSYNPSPST
jgi:hypothetical protein